jgi:hypothetical protein
MLSFYEGSTYVWLKTSENEAFTLDNKLFL